MRRLLANVLLAAAATAATASVSADPGGMVPGYGVPLPGIVILPEQRFDPFVQGLLARRELRALPIGSSGVLYLYPVTQDPSLLEAQIRYLDQLLQRSGDEPADRQP
jgi:hypothetical protein